MTCLTMSPTKYHDTQSNQIISTAKSTNTMLLVQDDYLFQPSLCTTRVVRMIVPLVSFPSSFISAAPVVRYGNTSKCIGHDTSKDDLLDHCGFFFKNSLGYLRHPIAFPMIWMILSNVNPGLINPKRLFNLYITIWGNVSTINQPGFITLSTINHQ